LSKKKKKIEFSRDQKRVGNGFGFHFPSPTPAHFSLSPDNERHPRTATNGTSHHHRFWVSFLPSRSLLSQSQQGIAPAHDNKRHPAPLSATPTHGHSLKSGDVVHQMPPAGPHQQRPPQAPSTPAIRYCAQMTHLQI
jgi:hypothetical protein